MNSLLHREGDDDLDDLNRTRDREITLGTTMILGIFFALAVLCAVFFAFGYQLGRKSVVTNPVATSSDTQTGTSFAGFKPAAGSPLGSNQNTPSSQTVAVPYAAAPVPDSPPPRPVAQAAPASDDGIAADPPASQPVPAPVPAPRPVATAVAPAPAPVATTPAPVGPGAIVQIAAVSHQEDADLLVTTLKRRGYNVAVHSEPQDKLLHVQVGPFSSRKDADVMRQKLLADGFNAIVKDAK